MANKYVLGISVLNEGEKLHRVLSRFSDYSLYDVLIMDDGSTDGSVERIPPNEHVFVVRQGVNRGAGHSVRACLRWARARGYEALFLVAGNDKDRPQDVARLVEGMAQGYDLVQGSRYLPGGGFGNMPFYRTIATRFVHPLLFSLISGRRITDSTNGFRAVRLTLLADPRLDLDQEWLDGYELEPYLFYKAIKLGYRVKEVPVTKIYPPKEDGYTKMKPFSGWWSILRPLVYLGLGLKN
jgi:dolichol-phosphate mannosyltransferase